MISDLDALPAPDQPSKFRVLVVEDNIDSAQMMAFMLRLEGYDVAVIHDGSDAHNAARTFRPKVILCDIGLPGMNGYEVAVQLRNDADLHGTRLIALTGYGQEEDRRRSREAGFDHHLVKPVDPNVLDALLDSIRNEENDAGAPPLR
jgi:CheY-like chemotaxis protein